MVVVKASLKIQRFLPFRLVSMTILPASDLLSRPQAFLNYGANLKIAFVASEVVCEMLLGMETFNCTCTVFFTVLQGASREFLFSGKTEPSGKSLRIIFGARRKKEEEQSDKR